MAYALYDIAQISQIHLFFDSVLSLRIKLYSFIYHDELNPKYIWPTIFMSILCLYFVQSYLVFFF